MFVTLVLLAVLSSLFWFCLHYLEVISQKWPSLCLLEKPVVFDEACCICAL